MGLLKMKPREETTPTPPTPPTLPTPAAQVNTWSVGEVATATQPVIYNASTEEQLDLHQALSKCLNMLEELLRRTG